jgi:hypothetical protein
VKGHKGVYQFLSIPYGTKGYDHEVMTTGTFTTSPLGDSTECTFSVITSDCSERKTCYRSRRSAEADRRKSTESNRERVADNSELTENGFDEPNGYGVRQKRWLDYSMSSDCSEKNLDELQADFHKTDILGHVTNNMHGFVFSDDDYI